ASSMAGLIRYCGDTVANWIVSPLIFQFGSSAMCNAMNRLGCLGLAVILSLGCGESTPPPSADQTAMGVKQNIDAVAERVIRAPKSAATELTMAIESLENHAKNHGGAYQELLDLAKEVKTKLGDKPTPQLVESEMGRLTSKAATLQK
ncbi:MAG TPA: hypothetical protein VM165_22625, partial [Planctomycetaceae bacterium]|nr:hypothetical protein [Planctomycetaceae bacterium]